MSIKPGFPLLAALVLGGCALQPATPVEPELALEIPATWHAGPQEGRVGAWLADFREPALEALVEEAMSGSFGLAAAAARVRAARAQARITGAATRPQIQVAAAASRADTGAQGVAAPSDSYELNGRLSWEVDLWGRLADRTRAARADQDAVEADFRATRLALTADVARQWFNLIEARAQRRLAVRTVSSFEQTLATIEDRFRQGIGDALDVRLARNNLANARANLLQRRRQQGNLARGLEILVGRYPAAALSPPAALPEVPAPAPAGLPARLLERRPDLLAAEARLRAAGYRRADAGSNRLPDLTLTASGGTVSSALRNLLELDDLVWTLAANLVQPVLQNGRLDADRDLAAARENELLNEYAQAALTAFREVEDALDAEVWLGEQVAATATAAAEARAAEELALEQYRRGLAGIITLLESQRRRFNAESALIEVRNLLLQNRINLYLALGGDFRTPGPDTGSTG